ncbi:hypothetical protein F5Y04DRAFT_284925 [Hypomontagnella monticulosa]|nr:hypothetical protein F5Y04DRAFT_284925 [Hypomontagnella monticulosa]
MATPTGVDWPAGLIPIELFTEVAQYLSRDDIKAMRLVNREFNMKLVVHFLRQIVIHLDPELSAKLGTGLTLQDGSTPIDFTDRLLDSGVFRNFGPDISRFGLSLELDERELATPSIGDLEEIHVRPWGIYRWPIQPDVGQSDPFLVEITKSLENCQGIFRLLSRVKNIRELALSCEGGLGYLQGPDVNPLQPPGRQPIFGDPNAVRDTEDTSYQTDFEKPYRLEVMEKKLASKGVDPKQIPVMIDQLLARENITIDHFKVEERRRTPLPKCRYEYELTRPFSHSTKVRLQPDQLTDTQKRFLFQHISAQQALVQAFMLSVIENSHSFKELKKVNIARLPSFHIDLLCRDSIWSELPGLEEVALGIVPDWRELFPDDDYNIVARQIYPTDALPKVFKLLNDHIGKQPGIKRLHFEWLCGGELAPGCYQRGRYILPAPFLKQHRMVIWSHKENLLILPHITHLSLKNCWFAPNVFYRIMRTMAKKSLTSLELETVSLSGPPIFRGAMPDEDYGEDGQPDGPGLTIFPRGPCPIRKPRWLSWSHIIDMLTPGETILERLHAEGGESNSPPHRIKKDLKLRKLVFKSCGYVIVRDHRFISNRRFRYGTMDLLSTNVLDPIFHTEHPRRAKVEPFMQLPTDRHLASIYSMINPSEENMLQQVFGLETGSDYPYGRSIRLAAKCDGMAFVPGVGRFSGTIEHYPKESEESSIPYVVDISTFDQEYDDNRGLNKLLKGIEKAAGYISTDADHQSLHRPPPAGLDIPLQFVPGLELWQAALHGLYGIFGVHIPPHQQIIPIVRHPPQDQDQDDDQDQGDDQDQDDDQDQGDDQDQDDGQDQDQDPDQNQDLYQDLD